MPSASATDAAIAMSTIVNAICAEARSMSDWSVFGCAIASAGSTPSTACRIDADRLVGATELRSTKYIHDTLGPTSADGGMSGPPAIDIGMYTIEPGSVSVSDRVAVLGTTRTTCSGTGAGGPARAG